MKSHTGQLVSFECRRAIIKLHFWLKELWKMCQSYHCCMKAFEDCYVGQAGKVLTYYQRLPLQKGYGLGGLFHSLFWIAVQLFKQGAKTLGKQVIWTGVDIANGVIQVQDLKTAAKKTVKEAGRVLTDKAAGKVKSVLGGNFKRKRKLKKPIISSKRLKRVTAEIFGPWRCSSLSTQILPCAWNLNWTCSYYHLLKPVSEKSNGLNFIP